MSRRDDLSYESYNNDIVTASLSPHTALRPPPGGFHDPCFRIMSEKSPRAPATAAPSPSSAGATPRRCASATAKIAPDGEHQSATLFPADNVTITGELVEYTNTPPEGKDQSSYRKTCVRCHSNVLNDHPGMGLTDIVSRHPGRSLRAQVSHPLRRARLVRQGRPSQVQGHAHGVRRFRRDRGRVIPLRSHRLPATVPSFALYDV